MSHTLASILLSLKLLISEKKKANELTTIEMAKGLEEMLVTHSRTRAHVHTHTHMHAPEILTPWGCLLTTRVTKWKTQRKTFVKGGEIKSLQRSHS